jgi:hypothetical protein
MRGDRERLVIEAVARAGDVFAEVRGACPECARLREQLAAAERALRDITDPISVFRRDAEAQGGVLCGPMANALSQDATLLKQWARDALVNIVWR